MSREEFIELCEQLVEIMETGTHQEAKHFLSVHSQDFSRDLVGETMKVFFESVLNNFEDESALKSARENLTAAIKTMRSSK